MIASLSALAEGFCVAVAGAAAFVWFYNRTLAQLHESVAKKVLALAGMPLAVLPGVALLVLRVLGRDLPGPAAFWSVAATVGAAVTLAYAITCGVKAWRERATRFLDAASVRSELDRTALPWWGKPVVSLLAPINGVEKLRVRVHTVRVDDLAPEFQGYRIAHLTDWHIHKTLGDGWYEHVAHETHALKPDVILFGGDFISKPPHVPRITRISSMLHARDGVWFVRGNHDFWKGPQRVARLARRGGMRLLSNEGVVLRRGKASLSVVGLETPYVSIAGLERDALERLPHPRVALVHTPEAFPDAARLKCVAALAGHTHGGQVRLPLFGTTISSTAMGPLLANGAGRIGRMLTVTSNGIGAFFPIRILCPPEIVLLVLKRAASRPTAGQEPLSECP